MEFAARKFGGIDILINGVGGAIRCARSPSSNLHRSTRKFAVP